MTITYPLSIPTIQKPSGIAVTLRHVSAVSTSPFTLQSQVFDWDTQAWQASLTFPSMTREAAQQWVAFDARLRGRKGSFLLGDPTHKTPLGLATGVPLVNGAAQTGYNLITDGWTASKAGILLAGDHIQLGTGSSARLHMLTTDAASNGSGQSTLEITPKLRYSPADNSAIIVSSPMGVFRKTSPNTSYNARNKIEFGFSLDAEEVIDVA